MTVYTIVRLPVYPRVIAVVGATYRRESSLRYVSLEATMRCRTLNEHNLEVRVGIGQTSSDNATRWTTTTSARKT